MSHLQTLTIAALLVVSLVGTPLLTGATVGAEQPIDRSPGELLSEVVTVNDASFRGELDERTIGLAIAGAGTDETRARLIESSLQDLEDRLDALERRQATLDAQFEAGELDERRYRADQVRLAAQIERIERLIDVIEARSDRIPAERLAEHRHDPLALETLRERTARLADRPESVSATARVAAIRSSADLDAAVENRIDHASSTLDRSEQRVERARMQVGDDDAALRMLVRATDELDGGAAAIESARAAHAEGHTDRAIRAVTIAMNHARTADALAIRALAIADDEDERAEMEAQRHVAQAANALVDARSVVDRAAGYRGVGDNPEAQPYLDRAAGELEAGADTLADARRALERGEYRLAIRAASRAATHAETAEAFANRAMHIGGVVDDDASITASVADAMISRAADRVDEAERRIDRAEAVVGDDREAQRYLDRSIEEYRTAEIALADGRAAYDRDDYDAAYRYAERAIDAADTAIAYADRAIELADRESDRDDDSSIDRDDDDGGESFDDSDDDRDSRR